MIKPPQVLILSAFFMTDGAAQARESPWFGTWQLRLKGPSEEPETLIYSDAGNGAMRMVSVEQKSIIVTRFDGRPAADIGAGAGKGNALAIRATSPTSYEWTFYLAGKPFVKGRNRLLSDLKSFKEVSWRVSKPGDVVTLIYDRR